MNKTKLALCILVLISSFILSTIDVYAAETCVEMNIYHKHAGNTSSGGLCYTPVYHSHNSSCYTSVNAVKVISSNPITYDPCGCSHQVHNRHCTVCNSYFTSTTNYAGDCTQGHSSSNTGQIKCCTKQEITCGKTSSSIDKYNYTCTKNTNTVVGKISLYKNNGNNYTLEVKSTSATISSYSWNTGAKTSSIEVTANGTYSCTVTYKIENRTESQTLSYEVTDYDIIPPTFNYRIDYSDMVDDTVAVFIENVYDEGGLHDTPYSYDGGNTWVTDSKSYLYGQGTFELCVRDKCSNIAKQTISLNCLLKANVTIVNKNDPAISTELTPSSFKVEMHNYTSYSFIRQKKETVSPQDNKWEIIIPDDVTYSEDILVTSSTNNGFKSRTTTLTVKDINADDYWYGVLVKKQTNNGTDIQNPIYVYNDIHIDSITATCSFNSVEAGTEISLDNFVITAIFNDGEKLVINNIDKYKNNILFENGTTTVMPRTVGVYENKLVLTYLDNEYKANFTIQIIDTTKPIIKNISMDDFEIYSTVKEQEITIKIEAEDNSDNPLMYAFSSIDAISSPVYQNSSHITHVFAENSYVNVFVKDYSGNVEKSLFYVCFVDLEAPAIKEVLITPDIHVSSKEYTVTVNATDDCARADELQYKFVLNGNVIQNYSNNPQCTITQNGSLKIYVKDKTGKETEYTNEIQFYYVDNQKPTISDVKIRVASNQIIASVEASDNITEELTYACNSYSLNKTQKNKVFTITQTGDYTFSVIDDAGNKQEKTIHIDVAELTKNSLLYTIVSNISLKPLGNVYEFNGSIYTNTGYDIHVYYKKGIDTSKVLTSLDKKDFKNVFTYNFAKNGNYTLYSRNTSEESEYTGPLYYNSNIIINGIDKEVPTLTVNKSNGKITVNTKDNMSGIKKIVIVTNDDGQTKETEVVCNTQSLAFSHSFDIKENKVYKIYCLDNVGNKSSIQAVSPYGILNTDKDLKIYQVVFLSEKGGILKEQQVLEGYPAVAPVAPEKKGFAFSKWSEDYSSVTKNLYIYPLYENLGYKEEIKPVYDETLRYKLVVNPFAFSSKNSGLSEVPLHKIAQINPYEEGFYEYKKETYVNDNEKITSGKTQSKEENILQKITITNPIVMIPLLLLVIVIIIVHLIKRKYTKEY